MSIHNRLKRLEELTEVTNLSPEEMARLQELTEMSHDNPNYDAMEYLKLWRKLHSMTFEELLRITLDENNKGELICNKPILSTI